VEVVTMPSPPRAPPGVALAVCALVVTTTIGCNRRVFEYVEPACGPTDIKDVVLADQKVDILVVVDNSGSMLEEQTEIARNFLNRDGTCPIPAAALADFARCDDADDRPVLCRYHNPSDELLAGELKDCGFLQILAAFDADFRVGVITTDVGRCDNRIPDRLGGEDRGFRPQRGCLQRDQPGGRSFIARDDVNDADPAVRDIAGRFSATLDDIRTWGSPSERGLDAVDLFFADDTDRDERCATDRDDFVRPDARLVLLFLSDEEDCSRVDGDGPFSCRDTDTSCTPRFAEFANDVCGADQQSHVRGAGSACYDDIDRLTPVSVYAERFRRLKANPADVTVAVIAGGVMTGDDVIAAGCDIGGDGRPQGGCTPLAGTDRSACPDCCLADAGTRYFALAAALGGIGDSICSASFKDTMIDIASFIGAVDVIRFSEPPTDTGLILVQQDDALVPRLPGTSCDDRDGWVLLDDGASLRLCGSARPGPGERLTVRAPLPGRCTSPGLGRDDDDG
jgi:hypothetical protein